MELDNSLLELINGIGQDTSMDILTNSFNNLQFRINYNSINHRLQDYIDLDIPSVNGNIRQTKNVIITSPTQVGKTSYIIENCKKNKNRPYLVVLTCDNSMAQMNQLKTRLLDSGIVSYDLKKATKSKIKNALRDGNAFFITMLNNESQITKLEALVNSIRVKYRPEQYIVFHDEADTVNKADIGVDIDDPSVPISHRKWLSFFGTLNGRNEKVKRFWITATPENCSSLAKITGRDIVTLPVPSGYVSISGHKEWDGVSLEPMGAEIERIRRLDNGEVILYCVDKKKHGQDLIAREISSRFACVGLAYNGDGAKVYYRGVTFPGQDFSGDDISVILDKLREYGPIVVVGYSLMNRGISFVAGPMGSIDPPPTATVMFYASGSGSHVVGIAQRFGRICGTSRPDLLRRVVYCSSGVYDDYIGYLENQRTVFDRLSGGGLDMTMAEILGKSGAGVKVRRSLDRPALKNVNSEYSSSSDKDSGSGSVGDYDINKMHRLVNSWKLDTNDTAIARLFRRILGCDGKLESVLVREYFTSLGAVDQLTTDRRKHNLVFRKDGRFHYIRDEVISYLE